jgi:hypothetical protein
MYQILNAAYLIRPKTKPPSDSGPWRLATLVANLRSQETVRDVGEGGHVAA